MTRKFPELYDSILQDTENRYWQISKDTNFSKKSTNPLDKRLDLMAYFLATILTLREKRFDFQTIKSVCMEIALEFVRPKNGLQKWLKKLPPKLIDTQLSHLFLKRMHKKISRKGHEDGFRAELITDKKETYGLGYGIDILECGICKLFSKYKAREYTPILCEVDKITSNLAGLELIRKGTIANGADKCDFRFKKK
ncbi:hypothetical protein D7Z94_17490 [Ulvibacterium marinum]|uniref:L-2-amino-thiazoline-4-carboxylic acid hydrolase n=1 Tax=Ulvibacterium marinum TaxID=2419782 RepID=A0A3B0CAY8_9FLAO|nr:hypothetical protein D7Z94_17490 [Ulvibacterium marinum]